jgi:H+/Cl- antiporter ClcA
MLGKVNAIFGFVMGLLMGVLSLLTSGIVSNYLQTLSGTPVDLIEKTQQLGFVGLLFFLFLGIITGFISGALVAVVYNAVAKVVGGLKIEVDDD